MLHCGADLEPMGVVVTFWALATPRMKQKSKRFKILEIRRIRTKFRTKIRHTVQAE
jgi:hypothetical protein